jgi:hypothetical protein
MAVDINWSLLTDAGANFANSISNSASIIAQRGRQKKQSNALSAYISDPDNPETYNALAEFAPQVAIGEIDARRKRQQAARTGALVTSASKGDKGSMDQLAALDVDTWLKLSDDQRKTLETQGKIFGDAALFADDPQKWDATIDALASRFPNIAQYKGKFSPALRASVIAEAGKVKELIDQSKIDYKVVPEGGSIAPFNAQGGYIGEPGAFQGAPSPAQPQPAPAAASGDGAAPAIIQRATATRKISPQDLATLKTSLGPNGDAALAGWMQQNGVQVEQAAVNPDQLRAEAAEAIRRGADPAAVNARLQQMLGGQ